MLTMTGLISCWAVAAIFGIAMLYFLWKRKWGLVAIFYFLTGFFLISMPFRLGMSSFTFIGMASLAAIWPFWLAQPLGYNIPEMLPLWFVSLWFEH